MKRVPYLLGLILVLGAAAWSNVHNAARTLMITYSDGHVQTVALDRDASTITALRFGEERLRDLSGQWQMRIVDPYASYVFDATLTPTGPERWQVEMILRETDHAFHRTRLGVRMTDCIITAERERVVMICDGYDPNPSVQGRYHAEYEGAFDAEGVLRGTGRHAGGLSHSTRLEMRRR
ncbi:MAG: hypothetical protein HY561_05540 [Gemmatimonadetes bacterium]|nr:hypothetical protein [Gemmatimonadota bacterium]